MSVHHEDGSVTLHAGDCREILPTLADSSVDSIVTDPPYELTSGKKGGSGAASLNPNSPAGRSRIGTGGFMGKAWDASGVAFDVALWAECLRVLKPGGHLLAFGGSRTWHRLAVAVEDAGFEMRDSIAWLYGSGFPKSLDVSKAIDKAAGAEREVVGPGRWNHVKGSNALQADVLIRPGGKHDETAPATPDAAKWQGWGTALKPAFEPIVVARKPLIGTVAANVLAHGTGALNVDACRVQTTDTLGRAKGGWLKGDYVGGESPQWDSRGTTVEGGRWPTNVVLDESQAADLDRQTGSTRDGVAVNRNRGETRPQTVSGAPSRVLHEDQGYGGEGGASRFFPTFHYEAKAPTSERPRHGEIAHPTVKPLDLMRWLVRLVTPPGGLVLDPFAGSGTTAEACVIEGFRCVTIEQEPTYLPLIVQRIRKPLELVLDFTGEAS